jgi:hypothetical protein
MANEIGFSTIYPSSGLGSAGPIGATGATGANQTVRGSTGATGLDSNYITSVLVNQDTGVVEFGLSNGTNVSPGTLIGATGVYAGVTAFSLGSGISLLKGVCGGITLDFYNFRTDGLLGITYSTDGALVFTISANSGAGGISPSIENDRIVYAQSKTTIMSTDLIPQASNSANRIEADGLNYGYINFGGETAGRNIVADITESSLSVGPIERGGFDVTLSDFYVNGVEGITLDVSRATVYNLVTPIGIKAFTTSNIITIPDGQIMSVTLIVHGEDVWNFPQDVVFDAESKPIFYPGVNILHMWKTNIEETDEVWRASFTARGIGARDDIKNPGVRGSCCYFDVDGTKHCDDYVTQTYCTERRGNFEGLIPCDKNSCIVGEGKEFDGVCCTEGKCVSDIGPSLCQIIGGYFISGITCGDVGFFEEDDETDNKNPKSGLCFNKCKTPTICCKNGTCLGQLTEAHCDYLEGTTVFENDCNSAKCCDHILARGACCTQGTDGVYECTEVDTPYQCNSTSGIYMGKNTTCNPDEDICCTVADQITCYECTTTVDGLCNCSAVSVNNVSCEAAGRYSDSKCGGKCSTKKCHKCDGTNCEEVTTDCGDACPAEYTEGACVPNVTCQSTTCYKPCVPPNTRCDQAIIPIPINGSTDCSEIGGEYSKNVCDDCPPPTEPEYAACFWCFPHIGTAADSTPAPAQPTPNEPGWLAWSQDTAQAPFRSVFSVTQTKANALDATVTGANTAVTGVGVGITLPAGLDSAGYTVYRQTNELYYTESNITTFQHSILGTTVDEPLRAKTSTSTETKFRCYYVGSYEQNVDPVQNRINCLRRYGYTAANEQTDCQLCDPVAEDTTYQTTFDPTSERTLDKIEPYQAIIKAGLHAPFPPIWGRITYAYGQFGCSQGLFKKQTTNLRLLNSPDRRAMMNSFKAGTGKLWLQTFLNSYDSSNQLISDLVLTDMFLATQRSIHPNYNISGRIQTFPEQTQPGPETCLDLEALNIDQLFYDPQRLGGDFFYGINFNNYTMLDCEQCEKGWVLPGPDSDNLIAANGSADNVDLANCNYYPVAQQLNSLGERYFVKVGADEVNYVRGIFGRNLRYNLDSFRSSTVFYNTDGQKTMQTNTKTAIPIAYIGGYSNEEAPCNPAGGTNGGVGGGSGFCSFGGGGCPPCACPACIGQTTCIGLCSQTGEPPPPGGPADSWNLQVGLIAPSTVTPPATPFKVQIKKSQITTKSVYITPGICVDMLCPDCNSYESC